MGLVAAGIVVVATRPDGAQTAAPDVARPAATGISGYLFQDRNRNGAHDEDEVVLPKWTVRVYSTGPLPLSQVVTDDRGVFSIPRIDDLTPGETTAELRVQPVMEGPAAIDMPDPSGLSQSFTVSLGHRAAVAVASFRPCLDQVQCSGLELPDLVPQLTTSGDDYPAPTDTRVDTTTRPGRVLLRFASSTANLGGVLHVVGVHTEPGAPSQLIQQRVYGRSEVLVHDAGRFVYHPTHHHFHMEGFERYELLSADKSTVLRTSGKVSFCLTDILAMHPPARRDGDVFLDLPPLECGTKEQGINTGFADYYGRELPDQWLDVTGVRSGRYWVRFTVDPEHHLLESDTTNNTVAFPVDLQVP